MLQLFEDWQMDGLNALLSRSNKNLHGCFDSFFFVTSLLGKMFRHVDDHFSTGLVHLPESTFPQKNNPSLGSNFGVRRWKQNKSSQSQNQMPGIQKEIGHQKIQVPNSLYRWVPQGCRFHFPKQKHRWYQAESKYWWNLGLAAWFRAKSTTLYLYFGYLKCLVEFRVKISTWNPKWLAPRALFFFFWGGVGRVDLQK